MTERCVACPAAESAIVDIPTVRTRDAGRGGVISLNCLSGTMCHTNARCRSLLRLTIALAIAASRLGAQDKPIEGILLAARPLARTEATARCPDFVVRGPRPFENVSFDDVKDSTAVET